MKAPVAMRALIARINRKLGPQDMQLKTARGWRVRSDVGNFYVVNTRINGIVYRYKDCDPVEVARDLGVLKPYERVVAD
jgi:hypothetical protein